jgi:hypothetical protein
MTRWGVFARSFCDGFGPSLSAKLEQPGNRPIPSPGYLRSLSDREAIEVIRVFNLENELRHRYAMRGLSCGAFSYILCVVAVCALTHFNHTSLAMSIIGVLIAVPIGSLISSRSHFGN